MENTIKFFKKIIIKIVIWEAKIVFKKYKPKVVAVTGSVGKTSTKDAIYTVLSKFHHVRKSEKNFNTEIGLSLTILGALSGRSNIFVWLENIFIGIYLIIFKTKYPKWLVLEMGVGKPGDIKLLTDWIKPDIGVLTRFPEIPVHVEYFKNTNEIIEEKLNLAHAIKEDGVLVLNHDDPKVIGVKNRIKRKTVSYGFDEHATYKASYPNIAYKDMGEISTPYGISFKMEYDGSTFPVLMDHVIGMNHIYAGLAAITVSNEIGCDLLKSIEALKDYNTPPGRLALIEGINESIIVDDTYNSSPVAAESAIDVMKNIKAKRKIIVLGDMLELGGMTEEAHKSIGKYLAPVADMLVTIGPRSHFVREGAMEEGFKKENIYSFESALTVGKFLQGVIEKGDAILIKGSQSMRMEKAVEMVMKNKDEAHKILCRQEKEWKNKI